MPVALMLALLASLGVHGLVLFGPDYELPGPSDPPPLLAELKPLPKAPPPHPQAAETAPTAKHAQVAPHSASPTKKPVHRPAHVARTAPAPRPAAPPEAAPADEAMTSMASAPPASPVETAAPAPQTRPMPAAGRIRYRVDRGDQGFQIGVSVNEWQVIDGAYRITAVTETTGLIGALRPLRIEHESIGHTSHAGLVPDRFIVRQDGRETENGADFDWSQKQLKMGSRPVETLLPGTQDVLSLPYLLGMLADPAAVGSIAITTGKKYGQFRLEVLGEEDVSVPAGTFHTLHLRVPGAAQTEVWLARDGAQMPVKVQHVDNKGNILMLSAIAIESRNAP